MTYKKISGFTDEISGDTTIQFEVMNKLGIKYFEPRGVDGKNISNLTEDEAIALKEKMNRYGVEVSSIGSPFGKIKLSDDFDAHFEQFKKAVQTAKILGTKYIRIFSFYHDGGEWTDSERSEVFKRTEKLINHATKSDIVLLHENEKDIYGDIATRCLDLMNNFYCENYKAVFDPANFIQCKQDTKEAYQMLKNYIEYMHIKDAYLSTGRVVPVGMGDGNVEYILSDLFKNGYDGFLSLEPHLGSFEGLADLELGDEMMNLPKSGEGTFTIAHNALIKLLNRI